MLLYRVVKTSDTDEKSYWNGRAGWQSFFGTEDTAYYSQTLAKLKTKVKAKLRQYSKYDSVWSSEQLMERIPYFAACSIEEIEAKINYVIPMDEI